MNPKSEPDLPTAKTPPLLRAKDRYWICIQRRLSRILDLYRRAARSTPES